MEQSTQINAAFHVRMVSFLALFLAIDLLCFIVSLNSVLEKGPSLFIFYGFEYCLLALACISSFNKYLMHTIDLSQPVPWEDKSMFIFYIDILMDFFKLISYIAFFAVVYHYYGLPIHIIRDVYMTLQTFVQRCKDLWRYRQATANMEQRYPSATKEEMDATDGVCIVCRENMLVDHVGGDRPKRLPCGHIFHFRCLRSWLERQQACPTWYITNLL